MKAKIIYEKLDPGEFSEDIIKCLAKDSVDKVYEVEISDYEDVPFKIEINGRHILFTEEELEFIK